LKTSNALVTVVSAEKKRFQESFKAIKLAEFLSASGNQFQAVGPAW